MSDTSSCTDEEVHTDPINLWLEQKKREREVELQELAEMSAASSTQRKDTLVMNLASSSSDAPSTSTPAREETQTPATQAILVEIHGLFETRPVTSALNSVTFRRNLESIVRESVTALRHRSPYNSSSFAVNVENSTQSSERSSSTHGSTPSIFSEASSLTDSAPVRVTSSGGLRDPNTIPSSLNVSANSVASFVPPPPPLPINEGASFNQESSSPDGPALPPIGVGAMNDDPRVNVEQLYHEQLIQDISELLHLGLVSNTLESPFRNNLEHRMQERLATSGTDGRLALDSLRSLPPSGHLHNDFTHMGIHLAAGQENEDALSIISATAQAIPMSQTSTALAREVRSMREGMAEMQATMQLLLDSQMETQRYIRQEVAAALARDRNQEFQGDLPRPITSQTANRGRCLICLNRPANTLLYRCGHLCMCRQCSLELARHQATPTCPVCRAPVEDSVQVYVVGHDDADAEI